MLPLAATGRRRSGAVAAPAPAPRRPRAVRAGPAGETHVVVEGDTLSGHRRRATASRSSELDAINGLGAVAP